MARHEQAFSPTNPTVSAGQAQYGRYLSTKAGACGRGGLAAKQATFGIAAQLLHGRANGPTHC